MRPSVHLKVEVLFDTLWGPACGYQARGRLTDDDSEVTCPRCLQAMGFEALPEPEQLTAVRGDPMLPKDLAA